MSKRVSCIAIDAFSFFISKFACGPSRFDEWSFARCDVFTGTKSLVEPLAAVDIILLLHSTTMIARTCSLRRVVVMIVTIVVPVEAAVVYPPFAGGQGERLGVGETVPYSTPSMAERTVLQRVPVVICSKWAITRIGVAASCSMV